MSRLHGGPHRHARRRSFLGFLFSPVTLLRLTITVLAGLLVAGVATGGTYALLNVSNTLPTATITAGSAALTLPSTVTFSPATIYPGIATYAAFTMTNAGAVPLTPQVVSLTGPTATPFSADLTVGAGIVASTGLCAAGSFTPSVTGTFASFAAANLSGTSILPSGSVIVCLSVTVSPTAAAGEQGSVVSNFSVTLGGNQP